MARNISRLKDNKYRKETKEERDARLQAAAEAREKCRRLVPFVVALLVGLMALFSFYVNSMSPEAKTTKTARKKRKMTKPARKTPIANKVPEGLKDIFDEESKTTVDTDDKKNAMLEEAIRSGAFDKAKAVLDEEKKEQEAAKAIPEERKEGETEEL